MISWVSLLYTSILRRTTNASVAQSATLVWMADITQITERNSVNFSADSTSADLWMREHYGGHNIFFDLPDDNADVLAFIEAAEAQGFSIRWL